MQQKMESKRKSRLRAIAIRLALLAVGATLAFTLTEILLIAADIAPARASNERRGWERYWAVRHELYGWGYVPGATFRYDGRYEKFRTLSSINAKGLREREYAYEKADGVFRVLVLGDSFTASLEVPLDQTWHELIEAELNKEGLGPSGVEIIAAGVQGWSTDQQYLFYLHEGYRYRPDLTLLQFYANDIYGNGLEVQQSTRVPTETNKPFFVLRDDRLVLTDSFRTEQKGQAAAQNRSLLRQTNTEQRGQAAAQSRSLLRQAKDFLRSHLRTYRLAAQVKQVRARSRRSRIPFCYEYDGVPPELFTYAPELPREYEAAWSVTARVIEELKSETGRRGQRFAIVYMPDRRQVLPREWQRTLECWPAAARLSWDLDKPNHLLGDLLTRLDTPYLDLTGTFRKTASAGRSIYFKNDGHLNFDGHRLVSTMLVDWLRSESLIPR